MLRLDKERLRPFFVFDECVCCVDNRSLFSIFSMLEEQVKQDIIVAMKAKDDVSKDALRMLSAALKNEAIARRGVLSAEQELAVLLREVKRVRESIDEFRAAGRDDLVHAAQAELGVYERYVPTQMTDDELKQIVQGVIGEVGATSGADIGRVMSAVMPKVKGQADGNRVRAVATTLLGS